MPERGRLTTDQVRTAIAGPDPLAAACDRVAVRLDALLALLEPVPLTAPTSSGPAG